MISKYIIYNKHDYLRISIKLINLFVEKNASFKFNLILSGLIIMLLTILLIFCYVIGYPKFEIDWQKILYGILLGCVFTLFIKKVLRVEMNKLQQHLLFCSLSCIFTFISQYLKQLNVYIINGTKGILTLTYDMIIFIIFTFIYGLGQYTDSFIKVEKYTSFYLSQCILIVMTFITYMNRTTENGKINYKDTLHYVIMFIIISIVEQIKIQYISISIIPIILYYLTQSFIIPIPSIIALVYHFINPFSTSLLGIILPDCVYAFTIIIVIITIIKKQSMIYLLCGLIPFFTIILSIKSSTILLIFILTIDLLRKQEWNMISTLYLIFVSLYNFFLTEHTFQFSSIQFNTGFIGVPTYNFILNGILIISNTFVFPMLTVIGNAVINKYDNENYVRTSLAIIAFFAYQMFSIMTFTYFQSGHLEIFRIFTPKVCFDAVIVIIVDIMTLFISFFIRFEENKVKKD